MYAFGEDGLIDQDWRPAAGCAPTPAWLRLGKMPAGVDESVASIRGIIIRGLGREERLCGKSRFDVMHEGEGS